MQYDWHGGAFLLCFESLKVFPGEAIASGHCHFPLCDYLCSWKLAFPCILLSGYLGSRKMIFSSGRGDLPAGRIACLLVQGQLVVYNLGVPTPFATVVPYYLDLQIIKVGLMENLLIEMKVLFLSLPFCFGDRGKGEM